MKDFFKGVLFVSLILPIINGLASIFCQEIEHICTKIAVKTAKCQEKKDTDEKKNPIGFVYSEDEEEEDEDHEGE